MRILKAEELPALADGAGILGTGGGTHPYLELVLAQKLYREGAKVSLMDASELADDDLVAVVSFMGAPLVSKERLPEPESVCEAVRGMEAYIGQKFRAVMSIEIGGENAFLPVLVGAMMNLPMVDADAMGRAFPEAQMTSFAIDGLDLFPFSLADIRANRMIITRSASAKWTERIGRVVVVELGSIAGTCKAPRTGAEIKKHAILGSVSRALTLGNAVRRARREHRDPIDAIIDTESGVLLFRGKVDDAARRTTDGFVRGRASIAGLGADAGKQMTIDFQNEFSAAFTDGKLSACVPDLICVLDVENGEALGTETIRYGQRVAVLALPAAPIMVSPKGLPLVGPRAFGFDFDYQPFSGKAA
jgi:uncharacterized protein